MGASTHPRSAGSSRPPVGREDLPPLDPNRHSASPALRSLLARARATSRAVHGHAAKKSANPVDRAILDLLVAARAPRLHGLRYAALVETACATGARQRRSISGSVRRA